jgi:hypothetical protein
MNPTILLRALAVATIAVALVAMPESSFAQRGGHGGFHGGGGSFHGGGFGGHASGFHGGGSGGFHGGGGFGSFPGGGLNNRGFGGFGGGRGFGGYGNHFSHGFYGGHDNFFFGFGFGWPYWGGYPYWYGYGPWWGPYSYYSPYSPYDYPDYPYDDPPYRYRRDDRDRDNRCRPDYRHPDNGCSDDSPDTAKPRRENPPPRPSNNLGPESSPDPNYVTINYANYRPAVSNDTATQTTSASPAAARQLLGARPAVENAIEALRAMPPDARERELNSGRFDGFTLSERELLNQASQPLQAQ